MTLPLVRTDAILITVSATLVTLAACTPISPPTPGSTTAGSTAAPTATPTPTVAAIDTAAPAPLLNLSCNDLASTAEVQKAYPGVPLVATSDISVGDLKSQANAIPASDFMRQAGGIVCLWDTIPSNSYHIIGVPTPSLRISVLFNAAAAWADAEKYGIISGTSFGACDVGICQDDELINGNTWLDVDEEKPLPAQQSQVFASALKTSIAAIKAAGTPAALPALDPATLPLGTQCTDFIANADVQSAIGTSETITASTPPAYLEDPSFFTTWNGAQDALHDHPCVWKAGGKTVGDINWLPGGAWAWAEAQTHPLILGTPTPLAVPGLHAGDSAWVRCTPTTATTCVADLVIGGNWIETTAAQTGPSSKLAAVTALATGIVAKLG